MSLPLRLYGFLSTILFLSLYFPMNVMANDNAILGGDIEVTAANLELIEERIAYERELLDDLDDERDDIVEKISSLDSQQKSLNSLVNTLSADIDWLNYLINNTCTFKSF